MLFIRTTAVATALCALVGIPANALSLADGANPAEFPPSSYGADVYVDSRGCVYIRAGFDDAVTWVPRVKRDRTVVCGMEPTFGGGAPTVAAAPDPAPDPAPVPAPRPAPMAAPKPAPAPAPAPKPATVAPVAPPAPVPVLASGATVRTVHITCPQNPAPGQTIVAEGLRIPLRCRAGMTRAANYVVQKADGTRIRIVAAPPQARFVTPAAQPMPAPAAAAPRAAVPAGYRAAWSDDRLNPYRGERSAVGQAQMNLIWTQTVPRRLVEEATGRDVTAQYPQLRYPDNVLSTKTGSESSEIVVSSKSIAEPARAQAPTAPTTHRYVQVGSFGVPSNAQNTVALLGRLGLPAAMIDRTSGGRTLQVVLAGPFSASPALQAALSKVRGAGFSDAFTRR